MRKFSGFALWVFLGLAVALVPLACGSSTSSDQDANTPVDTGHEMTQT